jgi:uncharacterized protein YgbK (DUF1537 family)
MIGVVADDITGSNDIGIMFAKANYVTHVYPYADFPSIHGKMEPQSEVVVLDTDSRFDNPQTAYEKVYEATKKLQRSGADRFYNKTCSVFRGNIGVEFDAMLDALGEEFAVVVLGFPKNGRKTVEGIHYVHGKRLEDSEFRTDPMHPMTESRLVDILKTQTKRKVGWIHQDVIKCGHVALQKALAERKKEYQYVILDVTDQDDLQTIAMAVKDVRVLCGSSALAEELPSVWGKHDRAPFDFEPLPHCPDQIGLLGVAGSLMPQTGKQIAYMREKGTKVKELRTLDLFEVGQKQVVQSLTSEILKDLNNGYDVILHSSNEPETVQRTKDRGLEQGLSNARISQFVSSTLAEITANLLSKTGQNRLLVAGGDTSAAVCNKLNIGGMRVWREIEPGLPSCVSLTEPPLFLVLKSGSFGKPDFFEQALAHLKGEFSQIS